MSSPGLQFQVGLKVYMFIAGIVGHLPVWASMSFESIKLLCFLLHRSPRLHVLRNLEADYRISALIKLRMVQDIKHIHLHQETSLC